MKFIDIRYNRILKVSLQLVVYKYRKTCIKVYLSQLVFICLNFFKCVNLYCFDDMFSTFELLFL